MKNTMINAREANARTNNFARELVNAFIEERVAPKVLEAVENGEFLVSFFVREDDKVNTNKLVDHLKELGYTIFAHQHLSDLELIGIRWHDIDIPEEEVKENVFNVERHFDFDEEDIII